MVAENTYLLGYNIITVCIDYQLTLKLDKNVRNKLPNLLTNVDFAALI